MKLIIDILKKKDTPLLQDSLQSLERYMELARNNNERSGELTPMTVDNILFYMASGIEGKQKPISPPPPGTRYIFHQIYHHVV